MKWASPSQDWVAGPVLFPVPLPQAAMKSPSLVVSMPLVSHSDVPSVFIQTVVVETPFALYLPFDWSWELYSSLIPVSEISLTVVDTSFPVFSTNRSPFVFLLICIGRKRLQFILFNTWL